MRKIVLALAALVASGAAFVATAAEALEFETAMPADAAAILTANDGFYDVLTPADYSIRLHRAEGGGAADLQRQYAGATLAWTNEENARLMAMVARHRDALASLQAWLPERVSFIKATTAVDSGLPHTRAAAIVFGPSLPESDAELDELFFHELFHVLSRHNGPRHDALYGLIGFERCTSLSLPPADAARLFTNPDAIRVEYVVAAPDGRYITPLLLANPGRYDGVHNEIYQYFDLTFAVFTKSADGVCAPVLDAQGALSEVTREQATAIITAKAGRNTRYFFHPEEIMADNFALLMTHGAATDAWVTERLAGVLGLAPAH